MNDLLQLARGKALQVLRRRRSSPDPAQDLAQEFTVRLWQALTRLREPRGFWRLFWCVLAGVIADAYRRRQGRSSTSVLEDDDGCVSMPDPRVRVEDQWVERDWLLAQLPLAMGGLRESTRWLLEGQLSGRGVRELARSCQVSEAAIKSRLHRGRQRLRVLLTDRLRWNHDREPTNPQLET
jgi:RNA polymerase sigma factor (sigma-70 family)